jgi:hypothetical protein
MIGGLTEVYSGVLVFWDDVFVKCTVSSVGGGVVWEMISHTTKYRRVNSVVQCPVKMPVQEVVIEQHFEHLPATDVQGICAQHTFQYEFKESVRVRLSRRN